MPFVRMTIYSKAAIILAGALSALPSLMVAQPSQPDELILNAMVQSGVSRAEAERRFAIDTEARALKLKLEAAEPSFASIAGDASAGDLKIFVRLTGNAKATLANYTSNPAFVAVNANIPMKALQNRQEAIMRQMTARGINAEVGINPRTGKIDIIAPNRGNATAALPSGLTPDDVSIIEGDPTPTPIAAISGGNQITAMNKNTTMAYWQRASIGFAVKKTVGTTTTYGILTAAHFGQCKNAAGAAIPSCALNAPAFYNPSNGSPTTVTQTLILQDERYGGDYDVEWRTGSADTFPNTINYGGTPMTITTQYAATNLVVGSSQVCKMGVATGATCGVVEKIDSYLNNGTAGSFYFVRNNVANTLMANEGDSGGPVIAYTGYATGIAIGSYVSSTSPNYRLMTFMPIERISVFSGVTLRTN